MVAKHQFCYISSPLFIYRNCVQNTNCRGNRRRIYEPLSISYGKKVIDHFEYMKYHSCIHVAIERHTFCTMPWIFCSNQLRYRHKALTFYRWVFVNSAVNILEDWHIAKAVFHEYPARQGMNARLMIRWTIANWEQEDALHISRSGKWIYLGQTVLSIGMLMLWCL